jgi:hypothetical protein
MTDQDMTSDTRPLSSRLLDPYPTPPYIVMSKVQRLCIIYLDLTGKPPYETRTSFCADRRITHYFFLDKYHTTSEDAAEDHLKFMIRVARLLPPPRHAIE